MWEKEEGSEKKEIRSFFALKYLTYEMLILDHLHSMFFFSNLNYSIPISPSVIVTLDQYECVFFILSVDS